MSILSNELEKLQINKDLNDLLFQAYEFYQTRYGVLFKLPDKYHTHDKLTCIPIQEICKTIKLLGIGYSQCEYYWLAKLYYFLPLPEDWSQNKDMLNKPSFFHRSGILSKIRPSIVYVLNIKKLCETDPDANKRMKQLIQTNYASFFHFYKDPFTGKVTNFNIKKYIFETCELKKRKLDVKLRSIDRSLDENKLKAESQINRTLNIRLKNNFMKTMAVADKFPSTIISERNTTRNIRKAMHKSSNQDNLFNTAELNKSILLSRNSNTSVLRENNASTSFPSSASKNIFFMKLQKILCNKNNVNNSLSKEVTSSRHDQRYNAIPNCRMKIPKILYNKEEVCKLQNDISTNGVNLSFNKLFKSLGEVSKERSSIKCPPTGASLLVFKD